jgi:hypothetical protein
MFYLELDENDWRAPIVSYLRNPNGCNDNTLKLKARKYVLMGEPKDVLYKRGAEGLLKCVSKYESLQVLAEVHESICGAHQSGVKMRWLIHRYEYFWPSVLKDYIEYAQDCESCQRHGPIPRIPTTELSSIIKPWPFRGWTVDLIGKVRPTSKKKNSFVIVATDYFTKWVEAKVYKNVTEHEVIQFYKDMIIHRFGLPQTIIVNNGLALNGSRVLAFAQDHGIKICNSTPYYAQANGQAESTNKIIKNNIRKVVDNNPTCWDELLLEVLWAYRTSKRLSINTTSYSLVYGHDAVIPVEIIVKSLRVARQNQLSHVDYESAMLVELDDLDEQQIAALNSIMIQKKKVALAYNKRIKPKSFSVRDMVWKVILPLGTKDHFLGKWSPN